MEHTHDELMNQRIYSMETTLNAHTAQLTANNSSISSLKNDTVRIREMQLSSGERVKDIFNRHREFETANNIKFASLEKVHKELEKSVKELHEEVHKNTIQHALEAGRHQERDKWTRVLITVASIASTLIIGVVTVYLK